MKKIILLFYIFNSHFNFAQNVYPADGNVGLGVLNPQVKLDVLGGGHFKVPDDRSGVGGLTIETNNGTNLKMGGNFYYSWIQSHMSLPLYINELGNNTIFNLVGGNVGIGTTNPSSKLDVNGNGIFKGAIISSIPDDGGGRIQLQNPSKIANGIASTWTIYNMTGVYGNSLQFWAYDNLSCGGGMCNNRFTIMDNGNVGIGSSNPTNKLDVNGTIHSKEVKVDMTGWSDFVFKKEYDLPTLEEVEKHINEKGHLENIPSEEEVVKNGINVGEMNAKLLQKIEELTLYLIVQEKKNLKQSQEIELLNKKLSKIEESISLKSN